MKPDPERDSRTTEWKKKARAAARKKGKRRNLYIITLHPDVLNSRKFRAANPNYGEGMPCVYVGITVHDPGDRFLQHKSGYKSSRFPCKYGVELTPELMEGFDETGLDEMEREPALADWLRDQGFGVWQN